MPGNFMHHQRSRASVSPDAADSPDAREKRQKTNRACDHCRRKKIRCEPIKDENICVNCREHGYRCTSILPSSETRKRKRPTSNGFEDLNKASSNYSYDAISYPDPTSSVISKTGQQGGKYDEFIFKDTDTVYQPTTGSSVDGYAAPQKTFAEHRMPPAPELDPSLVDRLIEIYWDRVHRYLPIVSKQQFYSKTHPPPPFLVTAMCAVAARAYSPSVPNAITAKEQEMVKARLKSMLIYGDNLSHVTLGHCQALLLTCTCYEYQGDYMAEASQAYEIRLTMAIRMAHGLGLHRGVSWDSNDDPVLVESKRRVWWACVILDRWGSTCSGRPLIINDNDMDVDPTSPFDLETPNSKDIVHQYFCELVKITRILGRVIKTCYRLTGFKNVTGNELRSIERALIDYEKNMPDDLKYHGRETVLAEGHLHIYYTTVKVLFYRPILHRRPLPGKENPNGQTETTKCKVQDMVPDDYVLPPNIRQTLRIQAISSINIITLELIQGKNSIFMMVYYCVLMATLVCVRAMNLEEGDIQRESTYALRGLREVIPKMLECGFSFKQGVGELIKRFLAVSQLDGPNSSTSKKENSIGHYASLHQLTNRVIESPLSGDRNKCNRESDKNLEILSSVALDQALISPTGVIDNAPAKGNFSNGFLANSQPHVTKNHQAIDMGGNKEAVINYFDAINNGSTSSSATLNNAFGGFPGSNPAATADTLSARMLGVDPTAELNESGVLGFMDNYLAALAGGRDITSVDMRPVGGLLNVQTTTNTRATAATNGLTRNYGTVGAQVTSSINNTSLSNDRRLQSFMTEGGDLFGVEDALWLDPASLLMANGGFSSSSNPPIPVLVQQEPSMYDFNSGITNSTQLENIAAAAAANALAGAANTTAAPHLRRK